MAQLVAVYQREKESALLCRQFPLFINETISMVMDLNEVEFAFDNPLVRGKELDEFTSKFNVLTSDEVRLAFEVNYEEVLQVLNQSVPCVGCRRSVERLLAQLADTGHPALDPLFVTPMGSIYVKDELLSDPQALCSMLHHHSERLSSFLESQPRSKKSLRCILHTLDSQRSRPVVGSCDWREVWDCMQLECRKEVLIIESATLLDRLNDYLRKHRFCGECRTKVLRAYSLLMEDPDPSQEKGYVAALYAGIRRCLPDKHIHLQCKTEYIDSLITRAEPELIGSRRERHAKTMETAQEEVLTCVGLCIYDRLHKIYNRMREEATTCQMLAAVTIEALHRNFETTVDKKRGVSQLDILYAQITKEEILQQQRKEHKKQRRRRRKEKKGAADEKENNFECECDEEGEEETNGKLSGQCLCPDTSELKPIPQNMDTQKLQVLDRKSKGVPVCSCQDCRQRKRDKNLPIVLDVPGKTSIVNGICNGKDKTSKGQDENKRKNGYKSCTEGVHTKNNNIVEKTVVTCSPVLLPPCNHSVKGSPCKSCNRVDKNISSSDNSQDGGYSSENTSGSCEAVSSRASTPEGSEIVCDGCCNHESDGCLERSKGCKIRNEEKLVNGTSNSVLTLQQMLEESCLSDEEESYIPAEEIKEFKAQLCHLTEKRQALRVTLREKFDQLCSTTKSVRVIPTSLTNGKI